MPSYGLPSYGLHGCRKWAGWDIWEETPLNERVRKIARQFRRRVIVGVCCPRRRRDKQHRRAHTQNNHRIAHYFAGFFRSFILASRYSAMSLRFSPRAMPRAVSGGIPSGGNNFAGSSGPGSIFAGCRCTPRRSPAPISRCARPRRGYVLRVRTRCCKSAATR